MTIYNFSAGPATLPKPVLEKAQAELLNYQDSGMSVLEMSHRSPEFDKIVKDAEATLRELMAIPDNYKVIFLQGGGSIQFSMLPLNLAQGKKAYYLVGGSGLGGGLIINGKLFQGSHFQAAELTFLLPVQMEKVNPSQMRGTTLSAVGFITRVNEVLGNADLKDGREAFKAINARNEAVYPIFEAYCRSLAITILNLQSIFDMEIFVLGGGISAQPVLIEEVNRQFDKVRHEIDFIGKIIKRPKIVACHHHNGANLIGAAYFLKQR